MSPKPSQRLCRNSNRHNADDKHLKCENSVNKTKLILKMYKFNLPGNAFTLSNKLLETSSFETDSSAAASILGTL